MSTTRRRVLTASIGLATPFIRPASAAWRSITFAAPGGLFQDLYEPAVVQAFVRAHPGLDVFYYAMPSSSQTLATLRRQRGQPEIDVVLLDLAAAHVATEEGLLEEMSPRSMPVLAELAPAAVFPGAAGPGVFTEPLVMVFDAGRTRPATNWKALWAGQDERSVAIAAPPDSAGVAFTLVAGQLFAGGAGPRAIQAGVTAISELTRLIASWDPRPEVYHFVGEGDAKMGVGWNMAAQTWSDRLNGRLGVVFPDEGTLSRVTTVNLVKGARQPDAARQFVTYLLGVEAQRTMVERMFLGPVNARARYNEIALSRTASTPDRAAHAMPVDWVAVNAIRDDIMQRWREVIPDAG
jgi:putative spermidine/putrescine transport system substrate-binding protein